MIVFVVVSSTAISMVSLVGCELLAATWQLTDLFGDLFNLQHFSIEESPRSLILLLLFVCFDLLGDLFGCREVGVIPKCMYSSSEYVSELVLCTRLGQTVCNLLSGIDPLQIAQHGVEPLLHDANLNGRPLL